MVFMRMGVRGIQKEGNILRSTDLGSPALVMDLISVGLKLSERSTPSREIKEVPRGVNGA
jgi:hypothetical protein